MDEEDGYFGERVAATYDDTSSEMFQPDVVEAVAEVLATLEEECAPRALAS